jgi:hypothetical protein
MLLIPLAIYLAGLGIVAFAICSFVRYEPGVSDAFWPLVHGLLWPLYLCVALVFLCWIGCHYLIVDD